MTQQKIAITMTGPRGLLGYWQRGASRNRFEPSLSPQGRFTGRMAKKRLDPVANGNHIPYGEYMKTRYGQSVVVLHAPGS